MARRRFFVDEVRGGAALVEGDDAHHLIRVLRVEAGQRYEISDNRQVYLAEVEEARKARVRFRILETVETAPPPVRITLAAALVKFERFEWIVEKATEMGVERIVPVETVRSERGLLEAARKRVERWRRIARESSQQARRVQLPEVADPIRLTTLRPDGFRTRLWLDEQEGVPLLSALPPARSADDDVCVLVGPEGGWTDAERKSLAAAWSRVWLGPAVLRAETAAVAALALVNGAWLSARNPDHPV